MERCQPRDFERVVIFTGAGMSAESGVPTYRGSGGIWSEYNYQDYACQRAFDANPERVWEFHDQRRAAVATCVPHEGYDVVVEMEKKLPEVTIITQNIDGMHRRAGNQNILELHGSLWRVRCDVEGKTLDALTHPMSSYTCACGAWLRPDIVWFEDPMKVDVLHFAVALAQQCDLFISIGTSGVVYPAASIPELASQSGAMMVEINPEDNEVSRLYDVKMRGSASVMLKKLWACEA